MGWIRYLNVECKSRLEIIAVQIVQTVFFCSMTEMDFKRINKIHSGSPQ